MRKRWNVVVAAVMIFSFAKLGTAAQGPQGVGAEKTAKSSHPSRSYNPVKWIKKDPNTASEKPKKAKSKESSATPATPDAPASPPKA